MLSSFFQPFYGVAREWDPVDELCDVLPTEWAPLVHFREPTEEELGMARRREKRLRARSLKGQTHELRREQSDLKRARKSLEQREMRLAEMERKLEEQALKLEEELKAEDEEEAKAREKLQQKLVERKRLAEEHKSNNSTPKETAVAKTGHSEEQVTIDTNAETALVPSQAAAQKSLGRVQVTEEDGVLNLRIAAKDLNPRDVKVNVRTEPSGHKSLHIKGQQRIETEDSVTSTEFFRSLSVPDGVSAKDVKAQFDAATGELHIKVNLPQ